MSESLTPNVPCSWPWVACFQNCNPHKTGKLTSCQNPSTWWCCCLFLSRIYCLTVCVCEWHILCLVSPLTLLE